MSLESNKTLVRRFVDRVFVNGDADAVDDLVSSSFTPRTWPSVQPGVDSLKATVRRMSAGLSDVRMEIEDLIAEGDRVAVRLTAHAVHEGEFMGIAAAGRAYTIGEIHIFRIQGDRIVEHWHVADMLGMLQQLGGLPQPARTG